MKLLHLRHANRAAFAASLVALLVLCICVVYWATLLLAPRAPIAPVEVVADPRAAVDVRSAASLFGLAGAAGPETATVTDIQVVGLAASRTRATALLAFDGKPARAYGEGDRLSAGIKVVSIREDAVLIERNGVQQKLEVPARASLAVLSGGPTRLPSEGLITPVPTTPAGDAQKPAAPASPATPAPSSSAAPAAPAPTPLGANAPAMMPPASIPSAEGAGVSAPSPALQVPTPPPGASAGPGVQLTQPNPLSRGMPELGGQGANPPASQ